MTAAPRWENSDQGDLLALVAAGPMSGHADHEWDRFKQALEAASDLSGIINPNFLRPLVRGVVAPQRIGALTHRALRAGLIAYTGQYVVSDDKHGGNAGKPCRELRWIGGAA